MLAVLEDYLTGMPESELQVKHGITRAQLNALRLENQVAKRHCNVVARWRKNRLIGEVVKCMICGLEFQNLSSHLVVHGLTSQEYVERFHVPLRTVKCDEHLSEVHREKFNRHPELRENLRAIGTRNITQVNAAGKGWRTPAGFWSEDHKRYMSQLLSGRKVTWVDKIKASHWSKTDQAPEIIDRICAGGKRFKHGWYTSTKTGTNEFYHSSYELRRMQELDADPAVLTWTKRHGISIPYQHAGIMRRYVPDLLIEHTSGSRVLEEVKGYVKDQAQYDAKCSVANLWCSLNNMQYRVNFMGRSRG
jgi:hypothetical protein